MKHLATLKRIIGCIALLLIAQTSFAQVQVTGTVVDEQGESLIGVSVMVEGTLIGIQTDIDGNFELNVPSQSSVLEFSYIGFTTQTMVVGARTKFDITLAEDSQMIDDVVVVGYGVQKKSHLTGSVSKYSNENLADMAVTGVDQALQGRIAGVNITNTTSEAGSTPQIRVRGMGSISASNEPLVVVDGYPSSDGLQMVDMNDVESVEVLKDAASSAIYGSRGANGVILVTTKSGSAAQPKYSVKAYTGIKSAYTLHDMMTTDEYLDMLYDEEDKGGASVGSQQELWKYMLSIDGWEDTNWQEVAMNDSATVNSLSFSVSGGKDDTKYYISTSYVSDDGIMLNSSYDKFNVRVKVDTKLSDAVTVGVNLAPTYTKKESNTAGFIDFIRTYSWMPAYHTEASAALTGYEVGEASHGSHYGSIDFSYWDEDTEETTYVDGQSAWGTSNYNPYHKMMTDRRYYETYALQTSAYINIELAEGLTFRSSNGFYFKQYGQERYHEANSSAAGDTNYALLYSKMTLDLLSENTLNYMKDFGKHSISAMVGYTANTTNYRWSQIYGTGFPTDLVPTLNAATNITITDEDGDRVTYSEEEEEVLVSYLGRLTYSYDDKYLLSASARADGSSKFGLDNQWGYFPSASIGWRVTEEEFMKNLDFINQFKVRASYGVTGTNDIDNYAAYNTLSGSDYTFGTSSSVTAGLANTSDTLGNTYISWEQTREYNYGVDLSFLGSRINVTADYYYSITQSMLLEQPTMAITGYSNYWNNIGRVRNKGWEFDINTYNIDKKDFKWSTNLNLAFNDNRLLELSDTQTELLTYGERNEIYIARVGEEAIQFYGYETDGIWLSQDEIDNSGLTVAVGATPVAGTLKIVDQNGDNIINSDDRTTLGSAFADWTWGLTNTFKYKRVDLSFQFYGSMGGKVMNGDGYYSETKKFDKAFNTNRFISEEYVGDGQTPTFSTSGMTTWELTDYLIEDATYIKLSDITLGYTFSKDMLKKIGLTKLRLYATGQNLWYWWTDDYTGINPESRKTDSQYSSPLVAGYQRGVYPIAKTVTVGIDINF
ncbi:MAG: TonB-dependent receptor [Rikenellaceae bacterium]